MATYKAQFARKIEGLEMYLVSFEAETPEEAREKLIAGDYKTCLKTSSNMSIEDLIPESVKWLKE